MTELKWGWLRANRAYGTYGNANQWTVNAGMASLARESAQNTNDARTDEKNAELVYTLIRLSGEARKAFQSAAHWPELLAHLQAMGAASEGAVTAGQIRAGVEALSNSDDLLLLQIADYGCVGLTGPEFPEDGISSTTYGNFIKLCRLDLFSGKDEAAGGSFGLGKAVYWRFSRLQTVLFNSCVAPDNAVGGQTLNRVFGVNQGVRHALNGVGFEGRGHFGQEVDEADIASVWSPPGVVKSLYLEREDSRPGTTALLIGFYDPDSPERGRSGGDELVGLAREIGRGIEESFWPSLTRERLSVRIRVIDDGTTFLDEVVQPIDTYTELVHALQKFDAGAVEDALTDVGDVVIRDIPIQVSARKDGLQAHQPFTHLAKLVVTLSDSQPDSLENSVCLIRRPEMVVQTLPRIFEGTNYHGFLLAGAAINPDHPSDQDLRADDFLRFSEPPAHDRWIPGSGRSQASQANLTARYVAPWIPNLRGIEKVITDALFELFGGAPPAESNAPEALLKHLRFLKGEPEGTGIGPSDPRRRPEVNLSNWAVEDGRWVVTFEISARNEPAGWLLEPHLNFVGLDGRGLHIDWESLNVLSGGSAEENRLVRIPPGGRSRRVKAVVTGVTTRDLPIPAQEAAIDVVIGRIHRLQVQAGSQEGK